MGSAMRSAYRHLLRLRSSEHGGALAELAVVLPLLILIAIGVMDYGRVYFTAIAVANAARAGAEWGSTPNCRLFAEQRGPGELCPAGWRGSGFDDHRCDHGLQMRRLP